MNDVRKLSETDVEPLIGGSGDADMDALVTGECLDVTWTREHIRAYLVAHGGVTVPGDATAVVVADVTVPLIKDINQPFHRLQTGII